jgi:hypothetical protein
MKRFLLLSLFFSAFIIQSQAQQPWAKPGATWYYSEYAMPNTGYMKCWKGNDTIINGINCDVIHSIARGTTNFGMGNYGSYYYTYPDHFTYINNDTVYYLTDAGFKPLYYYGVQAGGYWITGVDTIFGCADDTIFINQVNQVNINGLSLKQILPAAPVVNSQTGYNGQTVWLNDFIYERIGHLSNLLPSPSCVIYEHFIISDATAIQLVSAIKLIQQKAAII